LGGSNVRQKRRKSKCFSRLRVLWGVINYCSPSKAVSGRLQAASLKLQATAAVGCKLQAKSVLKTKLCFQGKENLSFLSGIADSN
jgi:hypothetical protein